MFSSLQELKSHHAQVGELCWIGERSAKRGTVIETQRADLRRDLGLRGDHRVAGPAQRRPRPGGRRQVTLIQFEHLAVIAALLGRDAVPASLLRRNFAVKGINLLALRDCEFRIGTVRFEGTGYCHPCSRMEAALGPGGYNAVRGHGGITAKVLDDGTVAIGDLVRASDATTT